MKLSIVIPVFNASTTLKLLVEQIHNHVPIKSKTEIILVDDGSEDESWRMIQELGGQNSDVKGIRLSKNFGQHIALTAGLAHATGDFVVVMDCDLQDHPRYIPQLIDLAKTGYDVVFTHKTTRRHGLFKNLISRAFYVVFNFLADTQRADPNVGCFSIMTKQVVQEFLRFKDVNRQFLMILRTMGFRSTTLEIEHFDRHSGKSGYTFRKMAKHAMTGIVFYSNKLLYLSISLGFLYTALAIVMTVVTLIGHFTRDFPEGWSTNVLLNLSSTGVILIVLGIIGLYLSNIFEQVKYRPLYQVWDAVNVDVAQTIPIASQKPDRSVKEIIFSKSRR